ncbi:MFS transporter [Sphingobium chungbukense]|uniref:MFS transporter n=1 Tax=Sphingobium chungbukense TaxID=56193 RepID=UPI000A03C9B3|nr:MFS transporter [Sphingobium chungbukense]
MTAFSGPVRLSRFGNSYVLALLVAINIVNYADRTLISVLAPAIQQELDLSNTQVGAITGIAFALTYGLSGLVLARWADRHGHARILVAAVATWSVMCVLTAYARSFTQLFFVRLGLGIGESGASPASFALIHTAFSDRARPIAYAIFSAGATVGIGTGVAVGGWLGSEYGWRLTMMIMAVPGLLLAFVFALTVKRPAKSAGGPRMQMPSALTTAKAIGADPLRRSLVGAYAMASFAYTGFAQWAPTFYMRTHGMSMKEVGATYSISSSGGALLGIIIGGIVVGRMLVRSAPLALHLCGLLAVCAAAASAAAFLVADRTLSLTLFAIFGLAAGATYAPTIALFQERSPGESRAFAGATMLLIAIIVGQGGGPFIVGLASDLLEARGVQAPLATALVIASTSLLLSAYFQFAAALSTGRGETSLAPLADGAGDEVSV